jgi:hypothetical protein
MRRYRKTSVINHKLKLFQQFKQFKKDSNHIASQHKDVYIHSVEYMGRLIFLHLHDLHFLPLHFTRSLADSGAISIEIHFGFQIPSLLHHPKSGADGLGLQA